MLAQRAQEVPGAGERTHLADHLGVSLALGRADAVPLPGLHVVAQEMPDELVAAHADRAMDPPPGHPMPVGGHRPLPGEHVVIVGVDERAVDVDDRSGSHVRGAYPPEPGFTPGLRGHARSMAHVLVRTVRARAAHPIRFPPDA